MTDKHIFYRSQWERQQDEGLMMMQDWFIIHVYPWLELAFIWYLIGIPIAFIFSLIFGSVRNGDFLGIKPCVNFALAWPVMLSIGIGKSSFYKGLTRILNNLWNG